MKYLFIFSFVVIIIVFFIIPARTGAFSQCRSDRKGYCVRLDQSDVPVAIQKKSSFLAAAFPGLEFLETYGIDYDSKIGETLSGLYRFGVVIAGISALMMFAYGGMRYLTSAGSGAAVSDAKSKMQNAIIGLLIIAGSYLILYTINPDFTFTLNLDTLAPIGAPTPAPTP